MPRRFLTAFCLAFGLIAYAPAILAQGAVSETFSAEELVATGDQFFGQIAQGMASVVESAQMSAPRSLMASSRVPAWAGKAAHMPIRRKSKRSKVLTGRHK